MRIVSECITAFVQQAIGKCKFRRSLVLMAHVLESPNSVRCECLRHVCAGIAYGHASLVLQDITSDNGGASDEPKATSVMQTQLGKPVVCQSREPGPGGCTENGCSGHRTLGPLKPS